MPRFRYLAQEATGKSIQGVVRADNYNQAVATLQGQGYVLLSIDELLERRGLFYFGSKVSDTEKMFMAERLASLLKGGLPLVRALHIISNSEALVNFRPTMERIVEDVGRGTELHVAFAKHPQEFPSIWPSLIEVGEASGGLPQSFQFIAQYLAIQIEVRGKIISALAYPAVLMVASLGIMTFFTLKIVPTFAVIFESFNIQLPFLTRALVAGSEFLRSHAFFIVVAIVSAGSSLRLFLQTHNGVVAWIAVRRYVPFFGQLLSTLELQSFLNSFQVLVSAGVSMIKSLEILEKLMATNPMLQDKVAAMRRQVANGGSLGAAFAAQGFPATIVDMVRSGEESGALTEMLSSLARYYLDEINILVRRFTAVIDPVLIVFMGSLVAVLVIALFLPIFQLSSVAR
ncbi:MAG: type II secretion system F family protein [Elusimicrobia bacterium]|nr:type II secretion system F family protein [Elusimicrobiota bacterium]